MDYTIPGNEKIVIRPDDINQLKTLLNEYKKAPAQKKNKMMEAINIIRTKFQGGKIKGLTINGIGIYDIKAKSIPINPDKVEKFLKEFYDVIWNIYRANKEKFEILQSKKKGTKYFFHFLRGTCKKRI